MPFNAFGQWVVQISAATRSSTHPVPPSPLDHLSAPCQLQPTAWFEHGMTREYQVPLLEGELAILQLIAGRGWQVTIRSASTSDIDRGLFASPHDALMVLSAEIRDALEARRP
jgi:hypothetical protein